MDGFLSKKGGEASSYKEESHPEDESAIVPTIFFDMLTDGTLVSQAFRPDIRRESLTDAASQQRNPVSRPGQIGGESMPPIDSRKIWRSPALKATLQCRV